MSTQVMSDLLWKRVWLVGRECSLWLLANPEKCPQYENVLICYCCSIFLLSQSAAVAVCPV